MIKIAIIGSGAIADTHIESYLRFKDRCQIVAIVDLAVEKALEKAAEHKLEAPACKTHQELLERIDFDAASICLPPFAHAATAIDLLNAGKHVLVEKPMAPSLQECDAMLEAAERTGALLSVVAQNRFQTPVMRLKRLLDSGLVGRVLHAQVDSFWWRGASYYDLWWRGTWEKEGGGCTLIHAVHHLDILHWMIGMPDTLQAVTCNLNHDNSEVEDFSTAVLGYKDGKVAQINVSLVHHGEEQQIVVQGEAAKVSVPWNVKAMRSLGNGFPEENPDVVKVIEEWHAHQPELTHSGHTGQIDNFLSAISDEAQLLVDGRGGRKTIELVTGIYRSAHLGTRIELPLKPDDPFYTREGIVANARHFHEKTHSVQEAAPQKITLGRKL